MVHTGTLDVEAVAQRRETSATRISPGAPGTRQASGPLQRVPLAMYVCVSIAALLVLAALLAPYLAPFNPEAQKLLARLRPPVPLAHSMPSYLLGTDELGRDLLSRCLYGMRVTR